MALCVGYPRVLLAFGFGFVFRSPPTADPELSGTGPQVPQELLACGVGQSWTPDVLRTSTGLPAPRTLTMVLSP